MHQWESNPGSAQYLLHWTNDIIAAWPDTTGAFISFNMLPSIRVPRPFTMSRSHLIWSRGVSTAITQNVLHRVPHTQPGSSSLLLNLCASYYSTESNDQKINYGVPVNVVNPAPPMAEFRPGWRCRYVSILSLRLILSIRVRLWNAQFHTINRKEKETKEKEKPGGRLVCTGGGLHPGSESTCID